MEKKDIIERLKELNFDSDQYWVITGSAMVLYGLRKLTHDIDLGCTKHLADELEQQGYPTTTMDNGKRKILIDDDIEIFEDWKFDQIISLNDIPVLSLNGLIEMKKCLGREKDYRDIQLIEDYLQKIKN